MCEECGSVREHVVHLLEGYEGGRVSTWTSSMLLDDFRYVRNMRRIKSGRRRRK